MNTWTLKHHHPILAPASALLLVSAGLASPGQRADAQAQPKTFYACYVPSSGALYRIKEPGLAQKCWAKGPEQHIEFSWTDGLSGNDHGALNGLSDDDHAQYLLASGLRALLGNLSAGGFKLTNLGAAVTNGDAVRFEQAVKNSDAAGGDLGGSYPNPSVAKLQGNAVSTNAPADGQILKWNAATSKWEPASMAAVITDHGGLGGLADDDHQQYLRTDGTRALTGALSAGGFKITGLAQAAASSEAVPWEQAVKYGDALFGDLTGSFPKPLVAAIRNRPVSATTPTNGQVLQYDGFQWAPTTLSSAAGGAAGGDLGGTYPSPTVTKLQGNAVSPNAPGGGEVLLWNGAAWTPTTQQHGKLGGLNGDDHPLYVLANGVRSATNGFAVTGAFGTGSIPTSGPGARLMWYPGKAAIRAGVVTGVEWDDINIGTSSTAFGVNNRASGVNSVALGANSAATGGLSVAIGSGAKAAGGNTIAMGTSATASGEGSLAFGHFTTANGENATAVGSNTTASGDYSTAMGWRASSNNMAGAFVYGDNSTTQFVAAGIPNSFVVRASGGTMFYSNSNLSAGVHLLPGGGAWSAVSDVKRKENFREVDGESVLSKLAGMSIREWNYKSQEATIRHIGPTAQEFFAAFGLGGNDTTITTIDADGVSLLAIQALERRTAELRSALGEIDALRDELSALRAELRVLAGVSTRVRSEGTDTTRSRGDRR